MRTSVLPLLTIAMAAAVAAPRTAPAADGLPGCELPSAAIDPLAEREALLAEYERMPERCLKQIVHLCTAAASQAWLDPGAVAVCSFGYEALLRQGFGGNFHALMAWWRSEQQEALLR